MFVEMALLEILRGKDMTAIVLAEKNGGKRQFPVFIGVHEANALEMSVHNIEASRPLTHDLVLNVINGMEATLTRVIIDKLENDTFYGKLDLRKSDNTSVWIDSRPSDAIVIASKTGVPIYCNQEIVDKIGAETSDDEQPEE